MYLSNYTTQLFSHMGLISFPDDDANPSDTTFVKKMNEMCEYGLDEETVKIVETTFVDIQDKSQKKKGTHHSQAFFMITDKGQILV